VKFINLIKDETKCHSPYILQTFRKRREEEAQRALEEARRLAEEMARKQAELEARLRFNRSLQMEANGLEHTQDITKAFVFSYFELLQWLGLDIPEFELLKLNQY
jgi:signal-transduction protein with cAMP-binding, CBS, and nucleotidyltransferase domain